MCIRTTVCMHVQTLARYISFSKLFNIHEYTALPCVTYCITVVMLCHHGDEAILMLYGQQST